MGSLADLLFARATGGTPAATANPPSLGDLLPDIAPPSAPTVPTPGGSAATSTQAAASQPTGTSPAPEAPSSGAPSAPAAPAPQGQVDTAPNAPPSPEQPRGGPASPLASALATLGFLPDLGASGPAQSSGPPLGIPAPAVPRVANPQVASPLPTSPQPASSSGPAPSADGATPFVSGGVFLSGRPSFVRTGLPSGPPFSPSPASLPTPASPPIAQGSSVPGPPATSVAAGSTIPSASPAVPDWTGATAPQAPGARPLAGLPGQLTPPHAPAADGKTASPLAGPARPVGMTPAMTLPPGALSPQEATAPPLPAATPPGASAYTAPGQVSTAPNPGQTINLTVVSVQRPGMAVEVMPGAPGDMAPTMDDAPLDPALVRPGVAPTVPGAAIPGTVVGVTRAGQPVVETPRGTLLLQARSDLPVGTKVRLAPAALPAPDLDPVPPAIDPARGRDWPALREALAVIAATDPALARHLIDSVLPRPTPQLTKTLVIFLAALRGGDAGGWLGSDALSTLGKAGRGRLSARLTDDFNTIANQAAEPNKDGWRTYAVPFGDEVGRLQVHVRAINEEEGEEAEGPARAQRNRPLRRFLIDLTLSRLGPIQLDGLIWTGRFDLVIRTRQLLPTSLTRELHGIYSNSLAAVGYSGALAFQTGAHGWVDQAAPASGASPVTRI
ncbi:hypothetical protein UCD39_24370 [Nitrospirillum sp. BR 11752]|uniref:hypothetical protein n=1 Tax=Nitrospirillum sp. BR 11752 TaxID=3104293 RepID=UPI002EA85559|nr:hypothetical protein [Nitrospirillum sp. BR 11752]